jgi:hypothetical protein
MSDQPKSKLIDSDGISIHNEDGKLELRIRINLDELAKIPGGDQLPDISKFSQVLAWLCGIHFFERMGLSMLPMQALFHAQAQALTVQSDILYGVAPLTIDSAEAARIICGGLDRNIDIDDAQREADRRMQRGEIGPNG